MTIGGVWARAEAAKNKRRSPSFLMGGRVYRDAMRVAYQGERGAFSESAARRLLGSDIIGVPCHSFEEMFEAAERGDADCCLAPIENSLAGSIHRTYDLLLESKLTIAARRTD